MGTSPPGTSYNTDKKGIPLLNGPTEFGQNHPNCTVYTTDSKRECKKGDLIFCVRGSTTGRMNWADKTYSLGRGVCSIRGEIPLDTKYIKYCLDYKLPSLLQIAGGATTFPNLRMDDICQFKIPYHSSRHKIAAILSAYDDLIENNTRRIKILEEMAQAIYREWFVHFRFPGHERVRMVESELGVIPEGWEIKKLNDICFSISDGDWIETKDQGGQDYRLLQVSNIGIGEFIETGNFRFISQDTFLRLHCQEVIPGDILISRMPKPTGRAWVVTNQPWKMITAVDVAIVKLDGNLVNSHFLINYLNSSEHLDLIEKHTTGTTRPRVTRNVLSNLKLIAPPLMIQNQYGDLVSAMCYTIEKLINVNANLRRTRDLLLPKLISGELDVSELDIMIPEAMT